MSIINKTSSNVRSINGKGSNREPSEYDGMWINFGRYLGNNKNDTDGDFVSIKRGVAVADLELGKIWAKMTPEHAAQVKMMNNMIRAIRKRALTLGEGESLTIQLDAQLYRRLEEEQVAPNPEAENDVEDALFGEATVA